MKLRSLVLLPAAALVIGPGCDGVFVTREVSRPQVITTDDGDLMVLDPVPGPYDLDVKTEALIERQAAAIDWLENRIANLEQRLRSSGSGAYRHGPQLGLGQGSDPSLLARLHSLESSLDSAEELLAAHRNQGTELRKRLADTQARNENLAARVDMLGFAEDQLESARQELAESRVVADKTADRLTASEIDRLRVEKRYYDLVRELITLRADETQRLLALQSRLRGEAAAVRPEDYSEAVDDAMETEPLR